MVLTNLPNRNMISKNNISIKFILGYVSVPFHSIIYVNFMKILNLTVLLKNTKGNPHTKQKVKAYYIKLIEYRHPIILLFIIIILLLFHSIGEYFFHISLHLKQQCFII